MKKMLLILVLLLAFYAGMLYGGSLKDQIIAVKDDQIVYYKKFADHQIEFKNEWHEFLQDINYEIEKQNKRITSISHMPTPTPTLTPVSSMPAEWAKSTSGYIEVTHGDAIHVVGGKIYSASEIVDSLISCFRDPSEIISDDVYLDLFALKINGDWRLYNVNGTRFE